MGKSNSRLAVIGAIVALAIAGGAVWLSVGGGAEDLAAPTGRTPEFAPGGPPPESAKRSATQLISPSAEERRSAMVPELAAAMPGAGSPPADAVVVLDGDGWRQDGEFAMATGVLRVPGEPTERIAIGFERVSDRWLVLFQESLA